VVARGPQGAARFTRADVKGSVSEPALATPCLWPMTRAPNDEPHLQRTPGPDR